MSRQQSAAVQGEIRKDPLRIVKVDMNADRSPHGDPGSAPHALWMGGVMDEEPQGCGMDGAADHLVHVAALNQDS